LRERRRAGCSGRAEGEPRRGQLVIGPADWDLLAAETSRDGTEWPDWSVSSESSGEVCAAKPPHGDCRRSIGEGRFLRAASMLSDRRRRILDAGLSNLRDRCPSQTGVRFDRNCDQCLMWSFAPEPIQIAYQKVQM